MDEPDNTGSQPNNANPVQEQTLNTQDLVSKMTNVNSVVSEIRKSIGTMTSTIISAFSKLGVSASEATKEMSSTAGSLDVLGKISGATGLAVNALAASFIGDFDKIGGSLIRSTSEARSFENQIQSLSYLKIPGFEGVPSDLARSADSAVKLRTAMLSSSLAGGGLSDVLSKIGSTAQGIDMNRLNQHIESNYQNMIIFANGINVATSAYTKYAQALQSNVPDLFKNQDGSKIENLITSNRSNLNLVQSAFALAEGTGKDMTYIQNEASRALENYNLRGKDALEYVAKMTEANQKLQIGMASSEAFAHRNAEAFKMLSDNADNSYLSLDRMVDSFRATGLSTKQSVDLIGNMTSGLSQLSVAQKSFLSSQTGGPGGLRGAFQIERMIREGKTNEVMEKVEENIRKQFGGKIFSQQEASESDYAASQFLRQRELLKSGALGIRASGDADATRILEAFKNGFKPTDTKMFGEQGDTLKKYASMGETMLESTRTKESFISLIEETAKLKTAFNSLSTIVDKLGPSNSERQVRTELQRSAARGGQTNVPKEAAGLLRSVGADESTVDKMQALMSGNPEEIKRVISNVGNKAKEAVSFTGQKESARKKTITNNMQSAAKGVQDMQRQGTKPQVDNRSKMPVPTKQEVPTKPNLASENLPTTTVPTAGVTKSPTTQPALPIYPSTVPQLSLTLPPPLVGVPNRFQPQNNFMNEGASQLQMPTLSPALAASRNALPPPQEQRQQGGPQDGVTVPKISMMVDMTCPRCEHKYSRSAEQSNPHVDVHR